MMSRVPGIPRVCMSENGNSLLFAKRPVCRVPSGFIAKSCCRPDALRSLYSPRV
ncbi:MAG: hypothetical protein BWX70_03056 [Verrucomicrobia bacterium ADurb.Bin070]|nr:MAG: hypothetical protein BWX70_03056 [Verrucomicrobia bacterium ADurb.Bin070]